MDYRNTVNDVRMRSQADTSYVPDKYERQKRRLKIFLESLHKRHKDNRISKNGKTTHIKDLLKSGIPQKIRKTVQSVFEMDLSTGSLICLFHRDAYIADMLWEAV